MDGRRFYFLCRGGVHECTLSTMLRTHTLGLTATMYLDTSGLREPLSTPADHFNYNMVYGINSYSAGAVLNQLEYIIGEEAFARGMKRYWNA